MSTNLSDYIIIDPPPKVATVAVTTTVTASVEPVVTTTVSTPAVDVVEPVVAVVAVGTDDETTEPASESTNTPPTDPVGSVSGFSTQCTLSPVAATFMGKATASMVDVSNAIYEHIKKNGLQVKPTTTGSYSREATMDQTLSQLLVVSERTIPYHRFSALIRKHCFVAEHPATASEPVTPPPASYTAKDQDGTERWYRFDGALHRDDDLPAVIYASGSKEWYVASD